MDFGVLNQPLSFSVLVVLDPVYNFTISTVGPWPDRYDHFATSEDPFFVSERGDARRGGAWRISLPRS